MTIPLAEKRKNILRTISLADYNKGKNYYIPYIEFKSRKVNSSIVKNEFSVESERTSRLYNCTIYTNTESKTIINANCNCPQFEQTDSCKHIAACLYHFYDDLFIEPMNDANIEKTTEKLFKIFKEDDTKIISSNNKKEVNVEIYLSADNSTPGYEDTLDVSLKIGIEKLYNCNTSKLSKFLDAYEKKEEYYFGKNFTYNPNTCYFSEEDKNFLEYLIVNKNQEIRYYYTPNVMTITGKQAIKYFLNLLKNKKIKLNNYLITEKIIGFPVASTLKLENDKNILQFQIPNNITYITSDFSLIQIKNTLYYLKEKEKKFLHTLIINNLDKLIFSNQQINSFKNTVLPIIKNQIDIDDNITTIKICKEKSVKLYFDLYQNKIICNLILIYDNEEINYFDKEEKLVREKEYENNILEELYQYNFKIEKNKLILKDLDDIAKFLDKDLLNLTKKYETYSSEKLKKVEIIKKSNIKSTFTIGKDNIMSYSFDLGDIKNDEITNIITALKNKKKYYRLKSGNIINLTEDKNLQDLSTITDEIGIKKTDLAKGHGTIPKFRAIYLDSLKKDEYNIIETDNSFNELIANFKEFKNNKLSFSKSEKELLRKYQLEGVKWLYTIDKTGFGGILADEMGLGKSIQTIYYIKKLLKENKEYKFLIVSPTSLAYNWQNEFEKFAPKLNYKTIIGTKEKRHKKIISLDTENILITTYGLLKEDKELYQKIHFKTMIIDEGQNIKNISTEITKTVKSMNADTKIALTGTPIENSILELWSIFDFIMPGFLTNIESFEKKYKIKEFDTETNNKIKQLRKLISPFILRRTKKEVIKDLPEKLENNIFIDLTTEQKKIYLAELKKVKKEMDNIIKEEGISKARFLILKLLTKLRQICIDPRLVLENYTGSSGKMEEFVRVVLEKVKGNHKILVFTSFKNALELARNETSNQGLTSYTIDGSVSSKKRIELVNKFNQDKTNIFFIMLKAGGTGLNLTSADVVIHLDLWWNPQAENQATDRAHRIGQKNVVDVIKFITRGTIEEKIIDLQEKKKILSDKLIDEEKIENAFNKLTENDIRQLLSYDHLDEE